MSKGYLQTIHPVLPVRDVIASLHYYVKQLGFEIAFSDSDRIPKYAGVKRDNIEIHLQWHSEQEWKKITASSLRFEVQNLEGLYGDYEAHNVFYKETKTENNPLEY